MKRIERELLDYQGASQVLGVPVGTLYAWVSQKRIPHIRLSGRLVRFDRDQLTEWVDQHRVSASEGVGR